MMESVNGVLATSLHRTDALKQREWFFEVDVSKYIAYFIAAVNHDIFPSAPLSIPMRKFRPF